MKKNLVLLTLVGFGTQGLLGTKSQFIMPEPELNVDAFNTSELEKQALKIQLKIVTENAKLQRQEKRNLAHQLRAQTPLQIAPRRLFQNN